MNAANMIEGVALEQKALLERQMHMPLEE